MKDKEYDDAVREYADERRRAKALDRYQRLGPEWHQDWMDEEEDDA